MTTLKLEAGGILPVVHVPGSKSYANRALILAALKPETFIIRDIPAAADVTFLIEAFKKIGLDISHAGDDLTIKNSFPACENPQGCSLHVGEGGTTARFLACLLLMGNAPYELILGKRLKERPWQEFIDLARTLGGQVSLNDDRLSIQGSIRFKEKISVNCAKTTQFASGLQLATAFTTTKVTPVGLDSSQSYWLMTEAMIQTIKSSSEFTVPKDWSSASYPLAFASLKQSVFFPGLHRDHFQADDKLCVLLEKMKVIRYRPDGIEITPNPAPFDFAMDVSDCLDLFPTLTYLFSHIQGTHSLTGFQNLAHKESDRLSESLKLLSSFGIPHELKNESLFIHGSPDKMIPYSCLQLPDDHRMVMVAALFLRHHGGGEISPKEAVEKSYPEFWTLFS